MCITNNRKRFSYGRKPKGKRLKNIMIPEYTPIKFRDYDNKTIFSKFEKILKILIN